MCEETPRWAPLSPYSLPAGHIQDALKGQVQQVLLNKAWSHHQQAPIYSYLTSHNATEHTLLETRPLEE